MVYDLERHRRVYEPLDGGRVYLEAGRTLPMYVERLLLSRGRGSFEGS